MYLIQTLKNTVKGKWTRSPLSHNSKDMSLKGKQKHFHKIFL